VDRPPASDSSERLQHVYRTPGRHTVTVTAVHAGCGPDLPTGSGTGRTAVRVTGMVQPGNGPVRPDAAIGLRGVAAGTLMGDVRGQDYDGHVLRTAIDFGDGTSRPTATARPAGTRGPPGPGRASPPRCGIACAPATTGCG